MFNFFRHVPTLVDYGERELCAEPSLLHFAEYQEYLACEVPSSPLTQGEYSAKSETVN
ncbi:hypothetical protein [Kluyvera intermedia]|jgi:hypothetical protein|uniref:Uncharacterized protein n=1 Tax=Kluyvera intermedia TaxID=61648 RepID=A0ABX6DJ34_KLUIN|nr:hypothetical protein [Kluyvera intermedia]QGH28802.1 hypothetical protein GHC21_03525 [Kluyvera intermedia]QGH37784.1 hypothetical protein GHC38_03525 [Kluyvera intermedia]WEJ84145.1 MAG: hypothetical protein P0Y47_19770 [Kluyvera intermedia]WQD30415.1 hypothetical protein U0026_03715 [Kluyvera intermedia]